MKILGIETSCDDTSVALVNITDETISVLTQTTASQIDIHKKYGGVIPEIAARSHTENIMPVVEHVMQGQQKPNMIAVTSGPGLMTALMVGVYTARTLGTLWNVPVIGVNHLEGHTFSSLLPETEGAHPQMEFPALALLVSGGHTELVLLENASTLRRIGATRDDAAGECFDKVAKLLKLEYPGGPKISKLALEGNTGAIQFPRPMIHEHNYDFSFAGLKTAVLYWLQDHPEHNINDVCASFEQAVVDVLVTKTVKAVREFQPKTFLLGGGVSANKKLRETLAAEIQKENPSLQFHIPVNKYCMDNAAMIALAGYYHREKAQLNLFIAANPNWKIA